MCYRINYLAVACKSNAIEESSIDDVSDEVYKDLVEWYFFYETQKAVLESEHSSGEERYEASEWYLDTPQYEKAIEKAKNKEKILPEFIFPNDLFIRRNELTETEDQFLVEIGKLGNLIKVYDWNEEGTGFRLIKEEEFGEILNELKESLEIKDSYNMFQEYWED